MPCRFSQLQVNTGISDTSVSITPRSNKNSPSIPVGPLTTFSPPFSPATLPSVTHNRHSCTLPEMHSGGSGSLLPSPMTPRGSRSLSQVLQETKETKAAALLPPQAPTQPEEEKPQAPLRRKSQGGFTLSTQVRKGAQAFQLGCVGEKGISFAF